MKQDFEVISIKEDQDIVYERNNNPYLMLFQRNKSPLSLMGFNGRFIWFKWHAKFLDSRCHKHKRVIWKISVYWIVIYLENIISISICFIVVTSRFKVLNLPYFYHLVTSFLFLLSFWLKIWIRKNLPSYRENVFSILLTTNNGFRENV